MNVKLSGKKHKELIWKTGAIMQYGGRDVISSGVAAQAAKKNMISGAISELD